MCIIYLTASTCISETFDYRLNLKQNQYILNIKLLNKLLIVLFKNLYWYHLIRYTSIKTKKIYNWCFYSVYYRFDLKKFSKQYGTYWVCFVNCRSINNTYWSAKSFTLLVFKTQKYSITSWLVVWWRMLVNLNKNKVIEWNCQKNINLCELV